METRYFVFSKGVLIEQHKQKGKPTHKRTVSLILCFVLIGLLFVSLNTVMALSQKDLIPDGESEHVPKFCSFQYEKLLDEYAESKRKTTKDSLVPIILTGDYYDVPAEENGSKRYMGYQTISSRSTAQWALQQDAWTDANGFRRYGELYMVAMGTYYTPHCGETFRITLTSGHYFDVIVADIKSDAHTNETHQHRNGNVIEFIVDPELIAIEAAQMGDMSYALDTMRGSILSIERIVVAGIQ